MVSQHLTAMLVICCNSVGQRNLYDKILNRSSHNKVLRQKLLFYLVVFEFLVNFSYNQSLFLWWYRVQIFTLLICTILSLENVSEKQDLCFHKIFWKKLKAYPSFGNWQVENLSKNRGKKQVCKKSAKKVCIFKKMQQQVCKNKKQFCKKVYKKSAYSKNTRSLQK